MKDNDTPLDKEAQDSVQSYLDLLLFNPAKPSSEPAIDKQCDTPAVPVPVVFADSGTNPPEPSKKDRKHPANSVVSEKKYPEIVTEKSSLVRVSAKNATGVERQPDPEEQPASHLTAVQRFTPTLRRKRDLLDIPSDTQGRTFAKPLQRPLLNLSLPSVKPPVVEEGSIRQELKKTDITEKTQEPNNTTQLSEDSLLETAEDPDSDDSILYKIYPDWAQNRFECLLFSVCGLTLAVPLTELGAIYPITEELTPIFGQVDWFLGLLPVKGRNIRVVNTARVVMPERFEEKESKQLGYVISINGVDWGLAADVVSSAISLEPENIRWRGKRSKRPWLAGTVVEHMCALLDVNQLTLMFVEQDK